MDLIGCAASISQLTVYLASSAVSLKRLYTELRNGDTAYRNEATNIQLLLNIFQRFHIQEIDNHDPILPVLIAISGLATELLHLLQPRKKFGINWTPLTSRDKISSTFESLDKKRRLLHLYITQAHQTALIDLRETIDKSNMTVPSGNSTENPNSAPSSCEVEGVDVDGVNSILTGKHHRGNVKIKEIQVKGISEQGFGDGPSTERVQLQETLLEREKVAREATHPPIIPGIAPRVPAANTVPTAPTDSATPPVLAAANFDGMADGQPSIHREASPGLSEVVNSQATSSCHTAQQTVVSDVQGQAMYCDGGDGQMNDSAISVSTEHEEQSLPAQQRPGRLSRGQVEVTARGSREVEKKDGQSRHVRRHH